MDKVKQLFAALVMFFGAMLSLIKDLAAISESRVLTVFIAFAIVFTGLATYSLGPMYFLTYGTILLISSLVLKGLKSVKKDDTTQ